MSYGLLFCFFSEKFKVCSDNFGRGLDTKARKWKYQKENWIERRFTEKMFCRKTMIQTLTYNNIPATDIKQLSGHKNFHHIANYFVVSEEQL